MAPFCVIIWKIGLLLFQHLVPLSGTHHWPYRPLNSSIVPKYTSECIIIIWFIQTLIRQYLYNYSFHYSLCVNFFKHSVHQIPLPCITYYYSSSIFPYLTPFSLSPLNERTNAINDTSDHSFILIIETGRGKKFFEKSSLC